MAVDAAVDGRSSDTEEFSELCDRMRAGLVHFEEVPLLRDAELGLSSTEVTFCLRDLHPLARPGSNQI